MGLAGLRALADMPWLSGTSALADVEPDDGKLARSAAETAEQRHQAYSYVPPIRFASGCNDRPPPHLRYAGGFERGRAPVTAIADLRTGLSHRFFQLEADATARRRLTVGSSAECDIALDDPALSAEQLILDASPRVVTVRASPRARTEATISGIPVRPDSAFELVQGVIIRAGATALIAIGDRPDPGQPMAVRSIDELVLASLRMYGSIRAAALALGIPRSTFHDHLKRALASLDDS